MVDSTLHELVYDLIDVDYKVNIKGFYKADIFGLREYL